MATEFQMPKLGLTMEAGTILQWLVDDMATVADGDAILVIETDKVESEVNASGSGVLKQTGEVGESYDCGERIGWFLEPGEQSPVDTPSPAAAPAAATSAPAPTSAPAAAPTAAAVPSQAVVRATTGEGGRLLASPNAKRVAAELGVDLHLVAGTGPGGRIVSEDVEAAAAAGTAQVGAAPGMPALVRAPGTGLSLASFAARKLADELGIDLDTVPALDGGPRLTRDDVVAHARQLIARALSGQPPGAGAGAADAGVAPAAAPTPPAPTFAPLLQEPATVVPMRGMRGTIAARMAESLEQMAQLTLFMDADMSAVVADRSQRKSDAEAAGDGRPVPGFTDYVIAASAKALQEHPFANSQITADGVAYLPDVHVGMAVALDDGLMVPVVRNTTSLDLGALSTETTRLATAVRDGKLQLDELEGGTFSVTALGMYGVDGFTPIINSPNTAILGVGRLRGEVAWDGDTPRRTTVLTLSLTWDHRAFDGAPAAEFTRTVARHLEAADFD